jgi:hypothetical protein
MVNFSSVLNSSIGHVYIYIICLFRLMAVLWKGTRKITIILSHNSVKGRTLLTWNFVPSYGRVFIASYTSSEYESITAKTIKRQGEAVFEIVQIMHCVLNIHFIVSVKVRYSHLF